MDFARDLRFAARQLRRAPVFTLAAAGTLALGIGVQTTLFAVLHAVLFRPLPGVRAPAELVWIGVRWRDRARPSGLSYPDFRDLAAASAGFADAIAAYAPTPLSLDGGGDPERVVGHLVSADYFGLLGVEPAAGRFFTAEEAQPGTAATVVLGHGLWTRRFAADRAIVGRASSINGRPVTVVGVAPPGFVGPEKDAGAVLWMPIGQQPLASPATPDALVARDEAWLQVLARRRSGLSTARVREALAAFPLPGEPDAAGAPPERRLDAWPAAGGLAPGTRGEAVSLAALLLAATGLVLLIAVANVANLVLARAARRRPELAVRRALGAGTARLLHQLFAEALLLAFLGGAAGLGLALAVSRGLLRLLPADEFAGIVSASPPAALAWATAAGLLAACGVGLLPALRALRGELLPLLHGASGRGLPRASRLQRAAVVAQLALCLVLLGGAAGLFRALRAATRLELGYEPRGVVAAAIDLDLQGYDPPRQAAFRRELRARLLAVPGVEAVAFGNLLPLGGTMVGVGIDGGERERVVHLDAISPGYLALMRIPLRRGREFGDGDRAGAPAVAIASETLAAQLWPGLEPLGQNLRLAGWGAVAIVGVAADSAHDEPGEAPGPFLYLPIEQRSALARTTVLVRADGGPARRIEQLRSAVRELDPHLPIFDARSLTQAVAERLDKQRGVGGVLLAAAGLALVLAAVGLAGLTAYGVAQRHRELGVRIALGATARDVLALVLGEGLGLVLRGVALGLLLSLPLGYALRALLGPQAAAGLGTLGVVAVVLAAVALAAAYAPARRATLIAPTVALRSE